MRLFVVIIGVLLTIPAIGQLNIKAAYRLAFVAPTEFNAIVARHEANFDLFEDGELVRMYTNDGFSDLTMMHGFDIGVRQRFNNFAYELSWMNKRQQLRADGLSRNGNNFINSITTRINTASFGIQRHIGQFNLEGSVDYNFLNIKSEFEVPAFTQSFQDHTLSSNFALGYTFKSSGIVSLCIKPFIQVYWNDYDLTEFDAAINDTTPAETPILQSFTNWGIAIIIYNGYQQP